MAGRPKRRARLERERREHEGRELEGREQPGGQKAEHPVIGKHGRRYDATTRELAVSIAEKHNAAEAERQTGIPRGTIRRWRHERGEVEPPLGADPAAWAERKREAAHETWVIARKAMARVRVLIEQGGPRGERDAKDAALTMAILLDKSGALEQASALADERQVKLAEAQVEAIAEALRATFDDLGLPRIAEIANVLRHHLAPLSEPDAPLGPAPKADQAREALRSALREEVREGLRREEWEVEPIALTPGEEGEIVEGVVVASTHESETEHDDEPTPGRRRV